MVCILSVYLSVLYGKYAVCDYVVINAVLPLELLTIQSAEENDFVIKYSPDVWKGNVNVWLGMYYDSNSKYRMKKRTVKTS